MKLLLTSKSYSKNNRLLLVQFLFLFGFVVTCQVCAANKIPFNSSQPSNYQLDNEPLTEFLARFFSDYGLRAVFSDALESSNRSLNGIRTGTPQRIFDSIANSNGLIAYAEGLSVYVHIADEIKREFILIPVDQASLLKRTLQRMDLGDDENYARVDSHSGVVEIRGVPRYIEQIAGLAEVIGSRQPSQSMAFHYFELKYAWASDQTFVAGNREIIVPGVASVIRSALQPANMARQSVEIVSDRRLKGRGLVRNRDRRSGVYQPGLADNLATEGATGLNDQEGDTTLLGALDMPGGGPGIVASRQHNAVIVRDFADRIPLYKDLITALDKPTPVIEIEASIIDINVDKLRELGIDWRLATSDNDGEIIFARDGVKENFIDTLAGNSVEALAQVPGFQIGAIIGDSNQFIARINALQEDGLVSISSRPKVATLNDLEAVIESTTSFYIPVEGAYEVDLFQVLTGTLLRVTPHLINVKELTQIRLIVGVEDGGVTGFNEGTPVTTRNAVSTQALINEGHSLLLGGLIREESRDSEFKVPLLGDIPVLGNLFKTRQQIRERSERMFLISPRIVSSTDLSTNRHSSLSENGANEMCEDCQHESYQHQPLMF